MMMPPPPSSLSLRDLLARERVHEDDDDVAPQLAPPQRPRGASSRSRSCRHASPPPPLATTTTGDAGAGAAVVAVLSAYAGRLLRDADFRRALRDKCAACLVAPAACDDADADAGRPVLANLELGIESIEHLAADGSSAPRDAKIRSLRNSIRLLSVVASLHSPGEGGRTTCGVPNSHLAACAQLYLAVVYKMERNDRVAARHLMQVFADAPGLARRDLLPDLWDHVFLPHLLHLKVWFTKEVDLVSGHDDDDRCNRRMKTLQRLYNHHMDTGTAQFAMYYKEWLNSGAAAPPPVPSVPLPSSSISMPPRNFDGQEKNSVSSVHRTSINRNLYNAVFGTALGQEDVKDAKLDDETGLVLDLDVELDRNYGGFKTEKLSHTE